MTVRSCFINTNVLQNNNLKLRFGKFGNTLEEIGERLKEHNADLKQLGAQWKKQEQTDIHSF